MQTLLLLDIDGTLVHHTNPFKKLPDVDQTLPLLAQRAQLGLFSQGLSIVQTSKLRLHSYLKYISREKVYIGLNKLSLLGKIKGENEGRRILIVDNEMHKIEGITNSNLGIESVLIDLYSNYPDYQGVKISSFGQLLEIL
jgi:hypothetical protein